ncbi:PH domain-containing protein [Micromonospora polyrhachis]|uniref:PH domain-containing protein n=1 Tax=Micromonospora polyrhachis TaxID=1282883 RepID=UPI00161CEE9B|nr:PH domain-containing protein [Micromonospora polyrhachis]
MPDDDRPRTWRVRALLPVLKVVGAGGFAVLGALLAEGDPVRWGLAALAAAGLLGWALRDLVAPVRLGVDGAGITVITGFAGRRHLDWARIERIAVDTRPRRGLRTELLEIDAGDSLHLFGRHDLGTAPDEVAAILQTRWRRATVG